MMETQKVAVDSRVDNSKKNAFQALSLFLIIMCVFFVVRMVKGFKGEDRSPMAGVEHSITITGHGEVQAVPDIASVYFTITKEAKTAKEAQDAMAKIESDAIASLKANAVADKDIKTDNASFYPQYEWQSETGVRLPCNQWGCQPNAGKNVIIGYQSTESITVKVRNIDTAGKVMQDLGTIGVTNLSGPTFSIDDQEALNVQARKAAIDNAKVKAQTLANDLGVKLGKVTSFSEGYNSPIMYDKAMTLSAGSVAVPAPAELPKGENTTSSDVTITYEIR